MSDRKDLIITNETTLSNLECLRFVAQVMGKGKVSNNGKQYCYMTVFPMDDKEICISTRLNKCSHKFIIWEKNLKKM